MRCQATTGLDSQQIEELVARVRVHVGNAWKSSGRPRCLGLFKAVKMVLFILRRNLAQEAVAELFHVSQATVSRTFSFLAPVMCDVLQREVEDREEYAHGERCVLIDGTLIQTWNWSAEQGLYSGKHKKYGMNLQVASSQDGQLLFTGKPVKGSMHDKKAFTKSGLKDMVENMLIRADSGYQGIKAILPYKKPRWRELTIAEKEINKHYNAARSPIERKNAHLKNWNILSTRYRGPLHKLAGIVATITALEIFREQW